MKNCPNCGGKHDLNGRFCSRSCANKRVHNIETKEKISNSIKELHKISGKYPEQKKKNKTNIYYKHCKSCSREFISPVKTKKTCSDECLHKIQSINASKQLSKGRGLSGWYKGYWCDSSWELAYVIYNLEHNISFERNNKRFNYIYQGKVRFYIPDFIQVVNGTKTYIEIKGYLTEQWRSKQEQFIFPLQMITEKEIKPYLKYVIDKYGFEYYKLYDGVRLKYSYTCNFCKNVFQTNSQRITKHKFCSQDCNGHYSYKL